MIIEKIILRVSREKGRAAHRLPRLLRGHVRTGLGRRAGVAAAAHGEREHDPRDGGVAFWGSGATGARPVPQGGRFAQMR